LVRKYFCDENLGLLTVFLKGLAHRAEIGAQDSESELISSDLQLQRSNLKPKSSDLEHQDSVLDLSPSKLKLYVSDSEPQSTDLELQGSYIGALTGSLELRPPMFELRPATLEHLISV
jgi:hypothetical protein